MSISSKTLVGWFAELQKEGFRKRGLVWCRRTDETVVSFELQKSKQGDRYYANVGVWFLSIGVGDDRPPHKCHFYGRFGASAVQEALDFETEPSEERAEVVKRFIADELLPAANQCSTAKGAADFFASGVLRIPLVLPQARQLVGLDSR